MTTRRHVAIVSVMLAAVALVGCSDDDKESSPPTTAAVAPTTESAAAPATGTGLVIEGFAFSEFTATAGQPFTITNKDGAPHTVTADDGSFLAPVAGGTTAELTIDTAGTYPIHCDVHPRMMGSLTVEG